MDDSQRYDEAVKRLETYGYEVIADSPGYLVRSRSDPNDISRARHLDDLVEFAQLVEWRARRDTTE